MPSGFVSCLGSLPGGKTIKHCIANKSSPAKGESLTQILRNMGGWYLLHVGTLHEAMSKAECMTNPLLRSMTQVEGYECKESSGSRHPNDAPAISFSRAASILSLFRCCTTCPTAPWRLHPFLIPGARTQNLTCMLAAACLLGTSEEGAHSRNIYVSWDRLCLRDTSGRPHSHCVECRADLQQFGKARRTILCINERCQSAQLQ
jgi:hypothetical protein